MASSSPASPRSFFSNLLLYSSSPLSTSLWSFDIQHEQLPPSNFLRQSQPFVAQSEQLFAVRHRTGCRGVFGGETPSFLHYDSVLCGVYFWAVFARVGN